MADYVNYDCLVAKRRDVYDHLVLWGYGGKGLDEIFDAWWQIRTPSDESWPYPTLGDYAYSLGCANIPTPTGVTTGGSRPPAGIAPPIPVPPNTSPGSGGRVTGAPPPTPFRPGQWPSMVRWVQDNPLILGAGLLAALLLFYRPGTVEFKR